MPSHPLAFPGILLAVALCPSVHPVDSPARGPHFFHPLL